MTDTGKSDSDIFAAAQPIEGLAELEALYGTCSDAALNKETDFLTPAYARFIARAPLAMLATAANGWLDISPRGDAPGFVHRIDDRRLALPDRRGNNRIDSLRNIIADPRLSLLFLVPGVNETLRVRGHGKITADAAVRAAFAVSGKLPASVLIIDIEKVYFQCARALVRGHAWDASRHANRADLPSAGEMLKQADPSFDAESYDAQLPRRQAETLY